jgi:hypothetical protein
MWNRLRPDLNSISNNTYAAPTGALLTAFILGIPTMIAGIHESVPWTILIPGVGLVSLATAGLVLFAFNQLLLLPRTHPTAEIVGEWFSRRGFSVGRTYDNPGFEFAFRLTDDTGNKVSIYTRRDHPSLLSIVTALQIIDVDEAPEGQLGMAADFVHIIVSIMGLSSLWTPQTHTITFEAMVPLADPTSEWRALEMTMRARQAVEIAKIVVKLVLGPRPVNPPSTPTDSAIPTTEGRPSSS